MVSASLFNRAATLALRRRYSHGIFLCRANQVEFIFQRCIAPPVARAYAIGRWGLAARHTALDPGAPIHGAMRTHRYR